jgi:biopolymer transport protein ExbB/TolQ
MNPLTDLFVAGGPVMVVIAGVSVLAWFLALRALARAGSLLQTLRRYNAPLLGDTYVPDSDESIDHWGWKNRAIRLQTSLQTIGACAATLPLLGLLGTVLGMLVCFNVIQDHGTGQPRLLAGGIGHALMTTQAGLWTALPLLFFHHRLRNRLRLIQRETELISHRMKGENHV